MAGIDLELKTGASQEEIEALAPLAKGLVLRICRPGDCPPLGGVEVVPQSNAILRTLATARPDSLLYGKDEFEAAQVCAAQELQRIACPRARLHVVAVGCISSFGECAHGPDQNGSTRGSPRKGSNRKPN